jgi:putative NADH-flavin reductase
MKVLVFGATGKTGSLVVDRALAQGHQVTALVRSAKKMTKPEVNIVVGDATNPGDVLKAMTSQHAVIDTIGGTTPYKTTQLESNSVRSIIAAMQAESVLRLIVVTMMGLGESRAQTPWWYKHLLMNTFLRGSTKDKAAVESEVRASGLQYIIVRPPILTEMPATGTAKIIGPGLIGHKITRRDLANFLVDQLSNDRYIGQAITVVNS